MSISTKSGDFGTTSLISGQRIAKNSLRVEAYGTIDELNSFIAEAGHEIKSAIVGSILKEIQNDLFRVAGTLASVDNFKYPVKSDDEERLTRHVHELEKTVALSGFVIPGSTRQSARLDICRTITRRAERRILDLDQTEPVPIPVKKYINRLSDLFYIMACFEEKLANKLEYKKWPE